MMTRRQAGSNPSVVMDPILILTNRMFTVSSAAALYTTLKSQALLYHMTQMPIDMQLTSIDSSCC